MSAKLYVFDDLYQVPNDLLLCAFHLMPPERRQRANQYRQPLDKQLCILAYLLLLNALHNYAGICPPVFFDYQDGGKPLLRDYSELHFSLSHCHAAVACAVSDSPIGVDVQDIPTFSLSVAERVCSKAELADLIESDSPAKAFCKLWVQKESVAKLSGVGIAQSPESLLCYTGHYIQDYEFKNYFAAMAQHGRSQDSKATIEWLRISQLAAIL